MASHGVESRAAPSLITNSIGMSLAPIPPGEFWMGAEDADPDAEEHETPRHRVRIAKPFYMGVHEVRVKDFHEFVQATGYRTEAERDGNGSSGYNADTSTFEYGSTRFSWRDVGWDQGDDHPILSVTWNDAVSFCAWLSASEGRAYRLPTEAEWEYACRAGTETRFSSGDALETLQSVANVLDVSLAEKRPRFSNVADADPFAHVNWWNDGYPFTAPVGSFAPNPFGLHDMHGNAWEWCADWYAADYSQLPDGASGSSDDDAGRVIRGGGFLNHPKASRSSCRNRSRPDYRNYVIGFRVVLDSVLTSGSGH